MAGRSLAAVHCFLGIARSTQPSIRRRRAPPILLWALRKCGQERIHLLENVGRWLEKGEWVASAAPYRRKLATWTYFYRAAKPGLAHSLMDRGVWAPSLYDGDATL